MKKNEKKLKKMKKNEKKSIISYFFLINQKKSYKSKSFIKYS